MAARFVPNPAGIAAVAGLCAGAVKQVADAIRELAFATAPEDEGDYKDSLKSELMWDGPVPHGVAFSDDYKAHWLEFGTVDTPIFATLGNAAASAAGSL